MITHFPSYYKEFKCIASKCKGSCCSAGWQIFIDEETANYYKSVSGNFGERLRSNINFSDSSEFILTQNGRCPFLNKDNLCDIYTALGPEHLCQICDEHPRFYECFNEFIECGLGIYCEEACRIILTKETPFEIYSEETNETISEDYDEEVFHYLYNCRQQIFDYMSDSKIPINSRIRDALWFTHTIQQDIDSNMLDKEEIFPISATCHTDVTIYLKMLLTLEPNDKTWYQTIENNITTYTQNVNRLEEFYQKNPAVIQYIKNLADYYIYRYFLSSVYDEDALSSFKFIAISLAIILAQSFCKWVETKKLELDDCIMIAKKYSEEIECSDDNLNKIRDLCYENINFTTENILGLF